MLAAGNEVVFSLLLTPNEYCWLYWKQYKGFSGLGEGGNLLGKKKKWSRKGGLLTSLQGYRFAEQ